MGHAISFPFYPPKIGSTYTFFDFTKDTLCYFQWLKNIKSDDLIAFTGKVDFNDDKMSLPGNMSVISRAITIRNEIDGGLLIHGVLAIYGNKAIIIAGDTGAGKTTTARRLQSKNWKNLSDDRTLIVRSDEGNYFAYPWPGGKAYKQPELRYDISKAYPVKGIFFVVKNKETMIKKILELKAVALLQQVADQAMGLPDPSVDPKGMGEMRKIRLRNIADIVQKIPLYELKINLTDSFSSDLEVLL